MIGTDKPGAIVPGKFRRALTADFPQVPDAVMKRMRNDKVKRCDKRDGQAP